MNHCSLESGPSPPTVSDYALVRRQFHIFERALKKFKSDVMLWIQYIQVAKREGARALVGRITARSALTSYPHRFRKCEASIIAN
jgi:U3 small nucleolar RNA-associated protein 6